MAHDRSAHRAYSAPPAERSGIARVEPRFNHRDGLAHISEGRTPAHRDQETEDDGRGRVFVRGPTALASGSSEARFVYARWSEQACALGSGSGTASSSSSSSSGCSMRARLEYHARHWSPSGLGGASWSYLRGMRGLAGRVRHIPRRRDKRGPSEITNGDGSDARQSGVASTKSRAVVSPLAQAADVVCTAEVASIAYQWPTVLAYQRSTQLTPSVAMLLFTGAVWAMLILLGVGLLHVRVRRARSTTASPVALFSDLLSRLVGIATTYVRVLLISVISSLVNQIIQVDTGDISQWAAAGTVIAIAVAAVMWRTPAVADKPPNKT